MPTPALPMTPPPVAPDRADRATFAARATASFDHLKAHSTPEIAAAMVNVYGNAVEAVNAASAAGSSASTATTKADQAAADRTQTGLDRAATAADRTQTGLDRTATSADRTQTGLDRTAAAESAAAAAAATGIPSISGKALKVLTVNAGGTAMEWAAPATVTLTGEVTTVGTAATVANAAVIGKVLTGFAAGAGTVAATDTILAAINKLVGNVAAKGIGTVTSVGMSVPTGLTVSGSPITSSGTLSITLTSGYSIPTTANQANWTSAYGWGNHASAGYYASGCALGTPSSGTLTSCTVDGTNKVGYRGIPQVSQAVAYTCTLADAGKHIYQSAAAAITIPDNASVAFLVGDAITFVSGASAISIAITTDTMRLAGAGTTGTRALAAYGMATAIKVAATEWRISGSGLS